MKDLGKTKLCLGLQIEHLTNGYLVCQSTTQKRREMILYGWSTSIKYSMVVDHLLMNEDPFRSKKRMRKSLVEIPYLSAIGAQMYVAKLQSLICLSVNFQARLVSAPIGDIGMGSKTFTVSKGDYRYELISYKDCDSDLVCLLMLDIYPTRIKLGPKQVCIKVGILSYLEINKAVYRSHFIESCRDYSYHEANRDMHSTTKGEFIKGDRKKHILPNLFYTHEHQKNGDIDVQQIRSSDKWMIYSPVSSNYNFQEDGAQDQNVKVQGCSY
ncbi:hypothetical protein P3S67_032583 [Capsicum chacoense]